MSKKIQTYNDLVEEKQRLETLLAVQKQQMKSSWHNLVEEAAPVRNVFSHFKSMFKADKSNPALSFGVKLASDVFLKRVVLAKADWVTRLIVPLFFRNYTSNFLNSDKTKTVFGKVKALFQRGPAKTQRREHIIRDNYVPQPETRVDPLTPINSGSFTSTNLGGPPTRESMQY